MRVLVTGAGGFIGRRIVDRLQRSEGFEVVPATRQQVDVTDPASVGRALTGPDPIDAIVHTAYGDERVTVEGTRTVARAAEQHGVSRIVHLSSIAVYGDAAGLVDERTSFAADARGYAAWKIAAEQALDAVAVPTTKLRPTIVYGPGSDLWIDGPLRRLRSGRWGTFGAAGEGTCNPVHVDDVAGAVEAALRTDAATAAGAFNVNGDETLTWNAWFTRLAAVAGLPQPTEISPARVRWRSAAAVPLKAWRKAVPSADPAFLLGVPARSERELFALHATYPTDAARRALGWSPRIDLGAGLAAAAAPHAAKEPR